MPVTQSHILIVEDDPEIAASLEDFLTSKGFATLAAASAEAASEIIERQPIDLILLDIMLPGEDGLSFCRRLRASGGPRTIMVTALSEPMDKVVGLELGADDYVAKPFDLRELLARIRAVLRRGPASEEPAPEAENETVYRFAGFAFYPFRRFVRSPAGLRVPLTGGEADLLLIFCQNPRKVLSREELIALTRGEGFAISTRSIDITISRLRRKLAGYGPLPLPDPIRTVRADGYAFEPDVAAR
jgi:two-component system OmpR family response regulator